MFDRRDRAVALFNLNIAFPDKSEAERRRILRASCRNLGRLAAEYCYFDRCSAAEILSHVDSDNPAWKALMERSTHEAVLVVTAHFGNWELLIEAQGLLGYPVHLIQKPMRNPLVDAVVNGRRQKTGTRTLPKKAAARDALRALKRGPGFVAIPGDQNQTLSFGVFVDFFGKPACTTPGAARFAMMTGAPVYAVVLARVGESDQHRFEVLPPIEIVSTGDRDRDVITNTQHCSDAIETFIRRYPEQWIWFHKRWKTRPPGEPKLYT